MNDALARHDHAQGRRQGGVGPGGEGLPPVPEGRRGRSTAGRSHQDAEGGYRASGGSEEPRGEATTPAERKHAAAEAEAAADLVEMRKELFSALFSGDEEKAGKLLEDFVNGAVDAKVAGRTQPAALDDNAVVNRILPKFQQVCLSTVHWTQLFTDYPEIHAGPRLTLLADRLRESIRSPGKVPRRGDRAGGRRVGKKYSLGSISQTPDVPSASATTTREHEVG